MESERASVDAFSQNSKPNPRSVNGKPRVSAIIPAFNEADRIGKTIRSLAGLGLLDELIVVDDGSHDDTAQIARDNGATEVIRLEKNQGKGHALTEGWTRATGDILVFLDADLGESAMHAQQLITPVMNADADMTIAILPSPHKRGGLGCVLRAARDGIRKATGRVFQAPLSGQRALTRNLMHRIARIEDRFGVEVALTIDALRAGGRVMEIPVPFRHRETGRDLRGFVHRWKQWRDVRKVLRSRLRSS